MAVDFPSAEKQVDCAGRPGKSRVRKTAASFDYKLISERYGSYFMPPKVTPMPKQTAAVVHEDLREPISMRIVDFDKELIFGSGNYCEVILANHKPTKKDYAIKVIDKRKCEQTKHTMDVLMEKHVLCRLRNELYDEERGFDDFPFPLIHATMRDSEKLYIVQEALLGGELWESIADYGCLWLPRAKAILAQILGAIKQLHSLGIVHRDLKLENVMLRNRSQLQGRDNSVVLIDFGTSLDLSRPEIEGGGNTSRGRNGVKFHHWVGTSNFMPPEAVHNRHSDVRNDLWSFGCLIYQLLGGAPPFQGPSDYLVFIKSGYMMIDYPPGMPAAAIDLIEKLLRFEPSDRLGAGAEPLGHAKSVDWSLVEQHAFFEGIDFSSEGKIRLCAQPIHQKLVHKLSMTYYKGLLKGSGDTEWLNDVSTMPSDCQLNGVINDSEIITLMRDFTQENRYRNECIQCQSSIKKRPLPEIPTDVPPCIKAILELSCDHCDSILSPLQADEVWGFIRTSLARHIFHKFRLWRDKERDDDYWEKLSNEYLKRNPLKKTASEEEEGSYEYESSDNDDK